MLQAPVSDKQTKPEASRSEREREPERLKMPMGGGRYRASGNQAVLQRMRSQKPLKGGILQRKCACGNAASAAGTCAECQAKQEMALQTKLRISEPGDEYEREADRMTDRVMRMPVLSLQRQPQPEESPTQSVPSNCVANPYGIHLPPIGAVHPLPPGTLLRPCLLTEARVRSSGNWCSDNHPHTGERCYRRIPTRSGFADCPPGDQYCFTPNGCCHSSPDIYSPVDESSPRFPGRCTDHRFCVIQHIRADYLPSRIRRLLQQAEDEFR